MIFLKFVIMFAIYHTIPPECKEKKFHLTDKEHVQSQKMSVVNAK